MILSAFLSIWEGKSRHRQKHPSVTSVHMIKTLLRLRFTFRSRSAWWDNKIILEMVNNASAPAAPGADVLITLDSQEGEQMRSGAKLLEEALKARTGFVVSSLDEIKPQRVLSLGRITRI